MPKSLQAILTTARERISAAKPTTLGDKPGVDYAPKSSGDRAFVAKHTHIEQDYPPGMEHAFTGEPVKYSLDDPKMAHYGNKEAEAMAANEEIITQEQYDTLTEEDQLFYVEAYDTKTLKKFYKANKERRGAVKALNKGGLSSAEDVAYRHEHDNAHNRTMKNLKILKPGAKDKLREELELDEVSKAALSRFKMGMARALDDKKKPEKPEKKETKEEVQIDEISTKKAADYVNKAREEGGREKGANLAVRKILAGKIGGNAHVATTEEIEPIDEVWKATQNEKGEHILKHKSGKVSSKSYGSKGEAIDAAVRKNKASGAFKEEVEPLQELSRKVLKSYVKKANTSSERLRRKGDSEEDKAMSTDGNKYPEKQARHQAAASKLQHKEAGRNKGIERAKAKLKEEVEQVDEFSIKLKHRGALTRKAKAAGESNSEFETAHAHSKGLVGKQARFAINAKKWHHEETEEEMDVVEGILCDKTSLGKKMTYHKGKIKNEEIGSVKFKHHQKQIHIIKGMLEEVELEEKKQDKDDDGYEYKLNKRGFLEKKRKYEKKDPVKEEVKEPEIDLTVARIADHITKEKF